MSSEVKTTLVCIARGDHQFPLGPTDTFRFGAFLVDSDSGDLWLGVIEGDDFGDSTHCVAAFSAVVQAAADAYNAREGE